MSKAVKASLARALRTGLLEIRAHAVRSILSAMAVAIGVASLLYTFIQTEGMRQRFQQAAEMMGPGPIDISSERGFKSKGFSPGLQYEDALAIRRAFPEMYMVSPKMFRHVSIVAYRDWIWTEGTSVLGITPEWARRGWVYQKRGRFINEEDMERSKRICVLIEEGGWLKPPSWVRRWMKASKLDELIKKTDLLGKTIQLGAHSFQVVGILKEPPAEKDPRWFQRFWGRNSSVLIPITAAQNYFEDGGSGIDQIVVDTGDEKKIDFYRRSIERLLLERHFGEKDVRVMNFLELIANRMEQQKKYQRAVMAMGLVCLLAGGIGIMNVTLAIIFSRIKEIGIRRALGASRGDILLQFSTEASLLGFLGGVLGIVLGHAGVNFFIKDLQWAQIASLSPIHYAVIFAIAGGTGFLSAVWPAWQAAKLDPVDALRYE